MKVSKYGKLLLALSSILMVLSLGKNMAKPLCANLLEEHEWSYFLLAADPVVFQFSARVKLFSGPEGEGEPLAGAGSRLADGLYLAYSQTTHWDFWAWEDSTPMLDTSYRPEAFWRFRPGGILAWLDLGLNHESNGLGGERIDDSRAWNRIILSAGIPLLGRELVLRPRVWVILTDEGNERIGRYAGYGELDLFWELRPGKTRLAGNLGLRKGFDRRLDRGRIEINLLWQAWPRDKDQARAGFPLGIIVQGFSGYGDTFLNYDKKEHHLRAGIFLNFD